MRGNNRHCCLTVAECSGISEVSGEMLGHSPLLAGGYSEVPTQNPVQLLEFPSSAVSLSVYRIPTISEGSVHMNNRVHRVLLSGRKGRETERENTNK